MASMIPELVASKFTERESGVAPSEEWREVIEERYNICMLFYCLCREDAEAEEPKYGAFDRDWVMANFAGLLGLPQYTLMRTIPTGALFDFYPIAYESCDGVKFFYVSQDEILHKDSLMSTDLNSYYDPNATKNLAIHGDKLYFGHSDDTIKVYNCSDYKNMELITSLIGHTRAIKCLAIHDGKLYSGADAGEIKVWNCSDHELIASLGDSESERHVRAISCLSFHGDKLYTGSFDNTLKVWNCHDYSLIGTLEEEPVALVLAVYDGIIYAGNIDKTISVFDGNDFSIIDVLEGHQTRVLDLIIQNGKLYSRDRKGIINVWRL